MNAAELLFKIQNKKNIKGVTVRAACRNVGTDSWMPKIEAPVDIYVREYAWEVRAIQLNPHSGTEVLLVAINACLELALADMLVQIEIPQYRGGFFE